MISLNAKINFNMGNGNSISSVSCNIPNELNYSAINEIVNVENSAKPYVGTVYSDYNGFFPTPYEITISGANSRLFFVFDAYSTQFPKKVTTQQTEYVLKYQTYSLITLENGDKYISVDQMLQAPENSYFSGDINVSFGDEEFYDFSNVTVDITYENERKIANISIYGVVFGRNGNPIENYTTLLFGYNLVTEKVYTDNDASYLLDFSNSTLSLNVGRIANPIKVIIQEWSEPYQPLTLKGIYTNFVYELNNRNLKSFDFANADRSSLELPSYGVISNSGNISFVDYSRIVEESIEKDLSLNNLKVDIIVKNLISDLFQEVGVFYTDKWNYDINNLEVSVSLKDDLVEWQNISLDRYTLKDEMTFYQIYEYLKSKTPSKFEFDIDNDTKSFLEKTYCKYPYIESGSLWSQFDKLCKVCALHIYKYKNKVLVRHDI